MNDDPNQTERWLMGELFKLSRQVSSYVIRMIGADAEKAGPPSTEEEFQLSSRLVKLGTAMQARATERRGQSDSHENPPVESTHSEKRKTVSHLRHTCDRVEQLTAGPIDGSLSIEAEEKFAYSMIDIAEQILSHSKARKWLLIGEELSDHATKSPHRDLPSSKRARSVDDSGYTP